MVVTSVCVESVPERNMCFSACGSLFSCHNPSQGVSVCVCLSVCGGFDGIEAGRYDRCSRACWLPLQPLCVGCCALLSTPSVFTSLFELTSASLLTSRPAISSNWTSSSF